jgi:hypothetical protein
MTKRPNPFPTKEPQRAAPVAAPMEVSQNRFDSQSLQLAQQVASSGTLFSKTKYVNESLNHLSGHLFMLLSCKIRSNLPVEQFL